MRILIGVVIAIILSSSIALGDDCDNAKNQGELNDCAYKNMKQADAELNKTYKMLMHSLSRESKQTLKLVEKTWIEFRDLDSDAKSFPSTGGTIHPMEQYSNLQIQTQLRIDTMESYYYKELHLQKPAAINRATEEELEKATKELTELHDRLIAFVDNDIINEDDDEDKDFDIRWRKKIIDSQDSWIKYRNLNCDAVSRSFNDSNADNDIRTDCLYEMTIQRIEDLKAGYWSVFDRIEYDKEQNN